MHTRVDIKWEKDPNEKNELVGVATVHVFTKDNSFAHQDQLVRVGNFAINVSSGVFGMSGMDSKGLPEMSDELRNTINQVATAYWYGWRHANTKGASQGCYLWKLEAEPEWTKEELASLGTSWDT